MSSDPLDALAELVRVLDELGLAYAVGGSVASSVHGEPRASADADILVELDEADLGTLLPRLEPSFYVSDDAAREAVRSARSFNVIHFDSMYKVDLFVAGAAVMDREQLRRRVHVDLGTQRLAITAAENLVVRKLDSFRQGGGVSDLQWRDVLGILKMQAGTLDLVYMTELARETGLGELLGRAMRDAGLAE